MAASSGEDWKSFIDRMCKLETENAELLQKVQQLEESIEGLIKAVNESNFCSTCSEEFGNLACSECPWYQAKVKAIRLLTKEEE